MAKTKADIGTSRDVQSAAGLPAAAILISQVGASAEALIDTYWVAAIRSVTPTLRLLGGIFWIEQ